MSAAQGIYEQTLVIRSQLGDESAFAELLSLYETRLFRFVSKMLLSTPDAVEDIAQEIWISIFKSLPTLRDPRCFKPWAFRIARDRVYREYRRQNAFSPVFEESLDSFPSESELGAGVASEALLRGLEAISPPHREALVLRYLEEMSYAEMSQAMGVSVGTVRSRIHYAKRALKALCEKESI